MTTTTVAPMRAFKWVTKNAENPNLAYYDIVNEYQNDSIEVIKSKILIRLNIFKGEWNAAPLGISIANPDPDFGLPVTNIKASSTFPDVVSQLIADEILKVENVTNVKLLSESYDAAIRQYAGSFEVSTPYGTTTIGTTF